MVENKTFKEKLLEEINKLDREKENKLIEGKKKRRDKGKSSNEINQEEWIKMNKTRNNRQEKTEIVKGLKRTKEVNTLG